MVLPVGVTMEGTAIPDEVPSGAFGEQVEVPHRMYGIMLCCANSVRGMVEEVARNLRGLGFHTEVVCGAEARAALLEPTVGGAERVPVEQRPRIHVLCVQGSLRETVLKPLRQALAQQSGPNDHLFVAVLDLSLPLAMVGQIRRFAEELEQQEARPHGEAALRERRKWRPASATNRLSPVEFEQMRTQAYRALHVLTRGESDLSDLSDRGSTGPHVRLPRSPARVAPTQKYRAITGSFAALTSEPSRKNKRRTRRAPGRVRAGRERNVSTAAPSLSLRERVAPPDTVDVPDATGAADASVGTAPPAVNTATPDSGSMRPVVTFGAGLHEQAQPRRRGRAWLGILAVAGLGGLVWATGGLDGIRARLLERPSTSNQPVVAAHMPREREDVRPPVADAERSDAAAAIAGTQAIAPAELAPPEPSAEPSEPTPDAPALAAASAPTPLEAAAAPNEPASPSEAEPEPSEPAVEATPGLAPHEIEARLGALAQRYQLRESNEFWVSKSQGGTTDWATARQRCEELAVDGVLGWRLPYRRELKLLGAIDRIEPGQWWSRSANPEDTDFVYVYDTTKHALVEWLKGEPNGQVVCVRRKLHPTG